MRNLQQRCERLAHVLMDRGDTLIDYGIDRRLGERAGWPAELVELHNARFEAFKQTLSEGDTLAPKFASSSACHSPRRDVRLAFAHARHGECAYVQAEVARRGLSDASMVARYRIDLQRNAPARAASAPTPR